MINPSGRYRNDPDSSMIEIEGWMRKLSENGGNYVRVWLSQSFWDMEDEKAGEYRDEKVRRIDWFVETARKYNLHIKMTLEHFRGITAEETRQSWATKSIYHRSSGGPLDSISEYLSTPEGHKLFLDKINFYQQRYGSDPLFFGWELWNEMNAVRGPEDSIFFAWNEKMLDEVKQRFPENLAMQSFGSFDDDRVRTNYKKMILLPGNEVAQVHRYLDLGAPMEICQAPMDIICSSAIEEIRSYNPGKPLILAETGAVEPRHTGPSKFYEKDKDGILLHDILFAPFFSGSAGTGMSWHWESYVDRNNLWYHFGRFREAVKGINPIEENFIPVKSESDDFRIYMLKGTMNILIWVRDKNSSWKTELEEGMPARICSGLELDLSLLDLDRLPLSVRIYDPWKNETSRIHAENSIIKLPDFRRSLVLQLGL
ncbi:MAG TPA: hypothetical protein VI583_07290 [Cyclobacteriaceae bacterium]|nr:hypothetical protein [Cyclobacteriaceae bacterium]